MRKIGIGTAGDPVTGSQLLLDNTITTILPDENLVIDPNGSGQVVVNATVQIRSAASLQFRDADNSNFVALKSTATQASDLTFTLPSSYGTSGQFMQSDGGGGLAFATPSITLTNDVSTTNNNQYIAFTDVTSGSINGIKISNNKLMYQPNTGALFAGILYGGEAASNNLILRTTTSGTKGQVYIDENTASSSTTTGALRVAGGAGIAGACYIGGSLTAASITETSSIAYKENVSPITNALDAILQLIGVTYDRKDGSTKNEAGLIAEDTAKVLPNLVTYKDGKPEGINYTKLSAYLIEAVKELKDEINDLKSK
jgi:hypothetical protein